jgi:hypothetical protein
MFFFVWLFYIRFCAYQGSKRVIGAVDALLWGMLFNVFGLFVILSSRRLDDERANAALLKEYKAD